MENLDTPQAKLLFVVGDLFKKQQIDQSERTALKGINNT